MATLADAGTVTAHRRCMFSDMGHADEAALNGMCAAFHPWLLRKMETGEYLAWLAAGPDGEVVAGAGLWLMDWPPHMIGGSARRGNVLNVYTKPEFRRQGLARRLMETVLDWCRANAIPLVILHASEDGRELYWRMGFAPSNEMRMVFSSRSL